MEINGVSFKDYACASANQAAGMSEEKICEVLGIEMPVWQDTKNQWMHKMAELSMDDMKFYGEVFSNPKQGKFADVEGGVSSDDALKKVPNIEEYAKIFQHMAVAEEHGIDSAAILENEYNMNFSEWSKAGSHYSQLLLKATDDQNIHEQYYMPHHEASIKWEAHFKEMYKDQSAGLSDDIDF